MNEPDETGQRRSMRLSNSLRRKQLKSNKERPIIIGDDDHDMEPHAMLEHVADQAQISDRAESVVPVVPIRTKRSTSSKSGSGVEVGEKRKAASKDFNDDFVSPPPKESLLTRRTKKNTGSKTAPSVEVIGMKRGEHRDSDDDFVTPP